MTNLVKKDGDIVSPQQTIRSDVFNTGTPAVAYTEVPAATAQAMWVLGEDEAVKRFNVLIDAEANDAIALSHADRERREAEVRETLLGIERQEASLVWKAQAQGLPVEHRADCHPLAILGGQLRTIPAGDAPTGSSPEL